MGGSDIRLNIPGLTLDYRVTRYMLLITIRQRVMKLETDQLRRVLFMQRLDDKS